MSNLLFNRKTAVVALASTALLGGGVAYAYPSGTGLTVSATASNNAEDIKGGTATVMNANPSCATTIYVDGKRVGEIPSGTTTGSFGFPLDGLAPGRHSVRARTLNCAKGSKEHAKSKFIILDSKVSVPPPPKAKKQYTVETSGLFEGVEITMTATLAGTTTTISDSDVADRRGEATTKFKFPKPGLWSVVITASAGPSPVTTYDVTVAP